MITIAKHGDELVIVPKGDGEIVVPLIANLKLGVYPFYREYKTTRDWHEALRDAMDDAGFPVGEYTEPLIAPDHQARELYLIWTHERDQCDKDWTPEIACSMCRRLLKEPREVSVFYAGHLYFSIVLNYKDCEQYTSRI